MAESATVIKWGIIGCGDVCAVKSGPAFGKVAGSVLQAVCRRDTVQAEQYAIGHGVKEWYTSAEALLESQEVNAIYIATPPESHMTIALKAAKAGLPTLLEKPMARCAAEAAVIYDAFERRRVPLFVAYYRRALPRYQRARELLKRIGDIWSVNVEVNVASPGQGWRSNRPISGGGLFVDVGSHVCDLLDWMFGCLYVTSSLSGNSLDHSWNTSVDRRPGSYNGIETYVIFTFDLPNVPSAFKNIAYFDFEGCGPEVDKIEVRGSEGTLSFPALGLPNCDPSIRLFSKQGHIEIEEIVENPEHVHAPLIQQIVEQLQGNYSAHCGKMTNGLRVAITVDAVLEWGNDSRVLRQKAFFCEEKRENDAKRILHVLRARGRDIDGIE